MYNLRVDEGEKNNIAKEKRDVTKELKERLDDWKIEVGARIPERNPDYKAWR